MRYSDVTALTKNYAAMLEVYLKMSKNAVL